MSTSHKAGHKKHAKGGAKRVRRVLRDNIQGITKPALRKLARRAGVKRISAPCYEDIRHVLKNNLQHWVHAATVLTNYRGQKTLDARDVFVLTRLYKGSALIANPYSKHASERSRAHRGRKHSPKKGSAKKGKKASGEHKAPHRFKPGTVSIRDVRKQQKSDKLIVPLAPFNRLVRELAGNELRISKSALLALHIITEVYLISLLNHANTLAIHAGRQSITPRDIQTARVVRGERHG